MDCGKDFDINGCSVGDTDSSFNYVKAGNKLMSFADYPYTSDNNCKYDASKGKGVLNNIYAVHVNPNDVLQAL